LASFLPDSEVDTGVSISECDPWSVRWLAPELLFPEEFGLEVPRRNRETDVYAFAMVMYEVGPLSKCLVFLQFYFRPFDYVTYSPYQVFSGSFPFGGLRNEASILRIKSGDRPHRPKNGSDLGLTEDLWKMMKECWEDRDRRWGISRIVSTLKLHSAGGRVVPT
jgi:hypothetical protein